MGIKEKMLDRIEKDSIKIDVEGQKVYLKKSGIFKEWRVIYPPVDPETKKWDITNLIFGGKTNAFGTFIVGIIVLMMAYGVYELVNSYNSFFENPVIRACLEASNIKIGD